MLYIRWLRNCEVLLKRCSEIIRGTSEWISMWITFCKAKCRLGKWWCWFEKWPHSVSCFTVLIASTRQILTCINRNIIRFAKFFFFSGNGMEFVIAAARKLCLIISWKFKSVAIGGLNQGLQIFALETCLAYCLTTLSRFDVLLCCFYYEDIMWTSDEFLNTGGLCPSVSNTEREITRYFSR